MAFVAKRIVVCVFCVLLLGLCACQTQALVRGLGQSESLEILVALNRAGIAAEHIPESAQGTTKYSVVVAARDYVRAAEVLHEYGLPRDSTPSLEILTKQTGFIPSTQDMAAMRLSLAQSAQVEHLLRALPGVLDVRVAIRSINKKTLVDFGESTDVGASVVIRYASQSDKLPFLVEDVKRIVTNSVVGLRSENVLLSLSRVVLPSGDSIVAYSEGDVGGGGSGRLVPLVTLSPFAFQVPSSQKKDAQNRLAMVGVVAMLSAGVVGLYLGRLFGHGRKKDYNTAGMGYDVRSQDLLIDSPLNNSERPPRLQGGEGPRAR